MVMALLLPLAEAVSCWLLLAEEEAALVYRSAATCIAGRWAISSLCQSGVNKAVTCCAPDCLSAREAEQGGFLTVALSPASCLFLLPACQQFLGVGRCSVFSLSLHTSLLCSQCPVSSLAPCPHREMKPGSGCLTGLPTSACGSPASASGPPVGKGKHGMKVAALARGRAPRQLHDAQYVQT